MMDKLSVLTELLESIGKDAEKFFHKGNKAAGTRARKNLQELKKVAQELRVEIQDAKTNIPSITDEFEVLEDATPPLLIPRSLQSSLDQYPRSFLPSD